MLPILCSGCGSENVSSADLKSPAPKFALIDEAFLAYENTQGVSLGYGQLYCSTPEEGLNSNPNGYALTSTYSGTAYKISAMVSVVDSSGAYYTSGVNTNTNSNSAISEIVSSKMLNCTFSGQHDIQETSTAGWQHGQTSKQYQ